MAKPGKAEPPAPRKPRPAGRTEEDLLREMEELRARLEEAEDTIHAIQTGGVDGLIVSGPEGERVFALEGADYPYRVLVEVMNEGVVTLGSDGTILSCNTRFAEFVKLPAEDVLGRKFDQFVARGVLSTLRAFLKSPSEEGRVMNADLLRADGTTMPAKLSAGVYEVGGLPALCIVVTDMTAFYSMAKTQLWLASIVNSSHDAVISKSLDNTILTWNAGAERMYGHTAAEAVGRSISIIVPPERANEIDMIDKEVSLARSIDTFETVRVTKSGVPLHVSLTVSPVRDMQGNITGASIIARDITGRKKIERELDEHRWYLEEMVRKRTKELSDRSEELQTVNEDLQTKSEELEIANEELRVQADELQSQQEHLRAANQALQASREAETLRTAELQAVLDAMPAAVMITHDPQAREMTGNCAAEELLCVPHSTNLSEIGWRNIKSATLFAVHDGVKTSQEELPVQRAARERVPVRDCEFDVVSRDGSVRHLLGNATPLDSGGAVGAFIDITERKRAEEALRESEERFRSVLDNSQDCIYRLNLQTGRYEYISPAAENILGYSSDELAALDVDTAWAMLHPDDLPILQAATLRLQEIGVTEAEYRQRTKCGEYRWLSNRISLTRSSDGQPLYRDGNVRDITERKCAEEAVRVHNATLEGINRILNVALTCETEEELGVACLEVAESITRSKFGFIGNINEDGLSDIAISNPGWDACVMTDAGGHRVPPKSFNIHGIYGRVIADGRALFTNDPANHRDSIGLPPGHPPLDAFLGVPLTHAGQTIGMIAVGNREGGYTQQDQEILEALAPVMVEAFLRKRAEDALKRSHEALEERVQERTRELSDTNILLRESADRLDEAQRMAHLGNWDWDFAASAAHWSDETYRLLGFEPRAEPPSYDLFLGRVHPDDRQFVGEKINEAVDRSESCQGTFRVILPGGGLRHLSAHARIVLDDQGEAVRITGTLMDITEQVRSGEEAEQRQQQLFQADKMVSLGIMTSGVAHEINNPNHSIMSNAALFTEAWTAIRPLLEREYEESGDYVLAGFDYSRARDEFPKMLRDITTASRRIEAIVAELRDYARYSPEETQTPVEVQPVIESACNLLTSMIKKSTDNFGLSIDGKLPKIVANRQRIEQVLINLIQNACQSLPDRNRALTVRAAYSPEKGAVIVTIQDEGTGIDPENLKHLGDPFFTTKRGLGGTGLGLWVSFNIVREHGGILDFFSEPGKGTRAELTLPVSREQ